MQPIRALMTGSLSSPSVFEIIAIIGKEHAINRLNIIIVNSEKFSIRTD